MWSPFAKQEQGREAVIAFVQCQLFQRTPALPFTDHCSNLSQKHIFNSIKRHHEASPFLGDKAELGHFRSANQGPHSQILDRAYSFKVYRTGLLDSKSHDFSIEKFSQSLFSRFYSKAAISGTMGWGLQGAQGAPAVEISSPFGSTRGSQPRRLD